MKHLILILPLVFVGFSSSANQSKTQVKTQVEKKSGLLKKGSQTAPRIREAGQYGTNHAFDGATLNGRLNEGSLRKIVVENDKSLDDLLGVRKKFDDRQGEEKQGNASW